MKKLSFLAALFLGVLPVGSFLSSPVAAQGTWILVHQKTFKPKPGTMGEYLNMGGFSWWVDAQSIVRRGDLVYFNVSTITLDKFGNLPLEKDHDGVGWSANCSTREMRAPKGGWKPWGSSDDDLYYSAGNFVCN